MFAYHCFQMTSTVSTALSTKYTTGTAAAVILFYVTRMAFRRKIPKYTKRRVSFLCRAFLMCLFVQRRQPFLSHSPACLPYHRQLNLLLFAENESKKKSLLDVSSLYTDTNTAKNLLHIFYFHYNPFLLVPPFKFFSPVSIVNITVDSSRQNMTQNKIKWKEVA